MCNESSEIYFTSSIPKMIERAKLSISRIVNGDRVVLKDFNKFWQNINIKQELFDYLIICLSQTQNKISNYDAALILLLLNSKKIDETILDSINSIFNKINNNDFTVFKDISIQDQSKLIRFFVIWFKHMNKNPIFSALSILIYPSFIHKNDPFLSLHQFVTESDYFTVILHYTFLFRTTSEENLRQTYDYFLKNFRDTYFYQYQQVASILLSEINIPYSNAALYNYNLIKCSNFSHILFVPFNLYKFFINIEVYSPISKYQSTYSLIDNIYYEKFKEENISPDPTFLSDIYAKLIYYCENAYIEFSNYEIDFNEIKNIDNSELWNFCKSKSIPRTSEPNTYIPLMYPFDPVGLPNELFISFSSTKINGVPFLLSGSSQNSFDKLRQGTESNLYAIVVGGAVEMMHVLLDYVNTLFEPNKYSIKKDLFILPILNDESRLSEFLKENDIWIRHNCSEIYQMMTHILPQVSNNVVDSQFPFFEPDNFTSYPKDFWCGMISPFSIFYRFFSFYCGCSAYATKFAVWIAFLTNRKHQVYAVPFIGSVILKPCTINGTISFNLFDPNNEDNQKQTENHKFNVIPGKIKIMNMMLQSEECFPCIPEDNALALDTNNLINEPSLSGPVLISNLTIKSASNEFFNLHIDSIKFSDIKCLKIQRLKKDNENIYISVRHFCPLKNGFD